MKLLYFLINDLAKKLKKEKRAFNKILDIIQDIAPFSYKHMSVLERANIEAQLARLDIVNITNEKL